jgi:DNA-binding GntR family transcriptional regulator
MSPGATFERVYVEIKRRLIEGELPPGAPIEPAIIGSDIASSITPVRDALHRLTGERLVEAPNHNGFRVPLLTEASLRDLYSFNGQLLGLAARRALSGIDFMSAFDVPTDRTGAATEHLFFAIARASDSLELFRLVQSVSDRLAVYRLSEVRIFSKAAAEYSELLDACLDADRKRLARALVLYHRRRVRAVPQILGALAE